MQVFLESGVLNKLEKMHMICESLMTGIIIIIIQHVRSNAIFYLTAVVKKIVYVVVSLYVYVVTVLYAVTYQMACQQHK